MKVSKISLGLFTVIILFSVINVSAQREPLPKCRATADQIYFVDSGKSVTEVHPGSNNGNSYQLNILGTGADKFTVVKESYMTSVSVIPGYTNASQAKWQIFFEPNMGQEITKIRMQSECTGRVIKEYQLTESVILRDQ